MTLLPIVGRELRVASRRRSTYRMRLAAALVAMVVFGWMMLAFLQGVPSTQHGRLLFRTLFGFAFVYCLFLGAPLTADCLSREKRDGTLGLLFLTDLKGYDVVFGKLAATSVSSLYALLAILPVISLPVQLGGVTAAELWQAAVVLLNTIFFSLSAGVLVSTLSRNERKAMFASILVVLLLTGVPFVLAMVLEMRFPEVVDNHPEMLWPVLALSPGFGLANVVMADALPPALTPLAAVSFRVSALWVHLLGWSMLVLSSLILPRVWQARGSNSRLDRQRERVEQWAYGRAEGRRAHRTRLLNINPFLWRVSRERWKTSYVWLYLTAVGGTWLWGWFRYGDVMFDVKTLAPTVLLFQTFLKLWITTETCNRLAEDRRIGALELLLSTPLTTREILRGHWLALQRQFAAPLIIILACEFVLLRQQFSNAVVLSNLAMLVVDLVTLGWVGMWLGLTARSLNRALVSTVLLVLVLPWGIYEAMIAAGEIWWRLAGIAPLELTTQFKVYLWFTIGLLNNFLGGVRWARRHLLADFREAATQRYQPGKIGSFGRGTPRQNVVTMRAPLAVS
jgi:ABC-type Na+ efflux pump permease subunit